MEVSLDAHNLINHFVVRHLGYLQDLSVPNNSAMCIFVCDDLSPCLGDSLYKQVFLGVFWVFFNPWSNFIWQKQKN